jgi:rhodanese-related sulfurtransferase
LLDESFQEYCIFTGDTLFVGDVGRPDLLDGKMSKEELAGMMYDSLNNKIKNLPDEVIVYPAHGPGSACGKNLGPEKQSTIGTEKQNNYALRDMPKAEFIKVLTDGLLPPPAYFFSDAMINKQGYTAIDAVMKKNMQTLSVAEFENEVARGAVILDTRNPEVFEKGFIQGSVNIGLNGMFAIWAGTIMDISIPMVLVCDPGKEEEAVSRLARVGYEKVHGFLGEGFESWTKEGKPVDTINSIDAQEFAKRVNAGGKVLDVRKISEAEAGYVKDATVIPLGELQENLESLNPETPVMVHCAGGYRSMVAASLLKRNGYNNIINVHGGWGKIKTTDVPVATGAPSNLITD